MWLLAKGAMELQIWFIDSRYLHSFNHLKEDTVTRKINQSTLVVFFCKLQSILTIMRPEVAFCLRPHSWTEQPC